MKAYSTKRPQFDIYNNRTVVLNYYTNRLKSHAYGEVIKFDWCSFSFRSAQKWQEGVHPVLPAAPLIPEYVLPSNVQY